MEFPGTRALLLLALTASSGCESLVQPPLPNVPTVAPVWTAPKPAANRGGGYLASDTTAVYLGQNDALVKIDAATGSLLWTVPTQGRSSVRPVLRDGRIFVVTSPETGGVEGRTILTAHRSADGAVAWQLPFSEYIVGQALGSTSVFLLGSDGSVTAVALADGTVRWRWADSVPPFQQNLKALLAVDSAVYVVGGDGLRGLVIALDAETGRVRRRFVHAGSLDAGFLWSLRFETVRGDGQRGLLLASPLGVYALDVDRWSLRWQWVAPLGDLSEIAVRGGTAYTGNVVLVAIDIATGTIRWRGLVASSGVGGSRGIRSIVACGERIVFLEEVASAARLSFLDYANGVRDALADLPMAGEVPSFIIEDGNRVYAVGANAAYAFPCRR